MLPGRYTVIAEKGLEFDRIQSTVDLKADQTVHLAPQRWVHMASKGWWSGDFHIHRPPEVAQLLLRAEDLNLGVFFTMWNKQNYWKDKSLPADPTVRVDSEHIATLMNEEDERGGGAWMMHNLKKPIESERGRTLVSTRRGVRRSGQESRWLVRFREADLVGSSHYGCPWEYRFDGGSPQSLQSIRNDGQ